MRPINIAPILVGIIISVVKSLPCDMTEDAQRGG